MPPGEDQGRQYAEGEDDGRDGDVAAQLRIDAGRQIAQGAATTTRLPSRMESTIATVAR